MSTERADGKNFENLNTDENIRAALNVYGLRVEDAAEQGGPLAECETLGVVMYELLITSRSPHLRFLRTASDVFRNEYLDKITENQENFEAFLKGWQHVADDDFSHGIKVNHMKSLTSWLTR